MPKRIMITCHGCRRKINALILKEYYVDKNINREHNGEIIYPMFTKLKIENHRKGLLKGRCNRSGKVFRVKGRYYPDDDSELQCQS